MARASLEGAEESLMEDIPRCVMERVIIIAGGEVPLNASMEQVTKRLIELIVMKGSIMQDQQI
jgi:hypothetical protein